MGVEGLILLCMAVLVAAGILYVGLEALGHYQDSKN